VVLLVALLVALDGGLALITIDRLAQSEGFADIQDVMTVTKRSYPVLRRREPFGRVSSGWLACACSKFDSDQCCLGLNLLSYSGNGSSGGGAIVFLQQPLKAALKRPFS
jgi:hypothetical protein